MGRNFFDINCITIFFFFDLSPKPKAMKAKVNTWDILTLRSFCIAKEAVDKIKRYPFSAEWEKICK